ncbi:MAG TPA: hypothetical protein VFC46_02080 [Humisphaera sp.]|nr:hypothetical protein [Humisphaera sp.]
METNTIAAKEQNPLTGFQWEPQPQAEKFVRGVVDDFLKRTPYAAELSRRMTNETGTRFFDWVESITLAPAMASEIVAAGFVRTPSDIPGVYSHPGGMFPTIILDGARRLDVTIRVESVADFAAAMGLPLLTADEPLSTYRRTLVAHGQGAELWAAERHGFRGFLHPRLDAEKRINMLYHAEHFRTRRREFENEIEGFRHANHLLDAAIRDLGVDLTCDLFFAAEREYWQRRNRAAQAQKSRQDRLGLGWANHDHHTYRSSREHFARMIATFEKLGFICRERFYAGAQAGWGAQVLEQSTARIVIFADVDLAPEELLGDFSREGLAPSDNLGTVGLWCALHGEAFLQAGMHHLECQFDFDQLREQMEASEGVKMMKPFTNFPYLRQAFTEGEVWPVRRQRIDRLVKAGLITDAQAWVFRERGALGSHLENLERNEGFKGFNQTGVSDIIHRTDPRFQGERAVHSTSDDGR